MGVGQLYDWGGLELVEDSWGGLGVAEKHRHLYTEG